MTDLTFIVFYRRDSDDRRFNLEKSLTYITTKFPDSEVILMNDSVDYGTELKEIKDKFPSINGFIFYNEDEFKKSFAYNAGANMAHGNVFCFWDVDVLIEDRFIKEAYDNIKSGEVDHVYPFTGLFINVLPDLYPKFLDNYDFSALLKLWNDKHPSAEFASDISPGGCNLISRKAFRLINGFDERFIGWGFEDSDFLYRSRRNNRVKYLGDKDAICWHLHHTNAKRLENPHYNNNILLFNRNNA